MRTPIRWQVTGAVGVGLLGVPFLSLPWTGQPPPPRFDPTRGRPPHTRWQTALHEAAFWRVRAVQLADDDCDGARAALGVWDPDATFHPKEVRRQFLTGDRAGYLRRARAAARRAVVLARSSRERHQAVGEMGRDEGAARSGAGL